MVLNRETRESFLPHKFSAIIIKIIMRYICARAWEVMCGNQCKIPRTGLPTFARAGAKLLGLDEDDSVVIFPTRKMRWFLRVAAVSAAFCLCLAHPYGAPRSACSTLKPGHTPDPQSQGNGGYLVSVSDDLLGKRRGNYIAGKTYRGRGRGGR